MSSSYIQLELPVTTPQLPAEKCRRRARARKPRSAHPLLPYAWLIQKIGMKRYFAYQDLADEIAAVGGPLTSAAAVRRFAKKNVPEVFAFRQQFYRRGGKK